MTAATVGRFCRARARLIGAHVNSAEDSGSEKVQQFCAMCDRVKSPPQAPPEAPAGGEENFAVSSGFKLDINGFYVGGISTLTFGMCMIPDHPRGLPRTVSPWLYVG